MNLVLDFGNTRIKTGLFDGDKLVGQENFLLADAMLEWAFNKMPKVNNIIISSVVHLNDGWVNKLNSIAPVMIFTYQTPTPIMNLYKTPDTLGSDRIAAAVGANAVYRNKRVLLIDAGTCIKYNYINERNEFLGGGISPGISLRFKALNLYTDKLPMVVYDKYFHSLIGNDTVSSMRMGVQIGFNAEVKGVIELFNLKYDNLTIVLTGGNALSLQKALNNNIFADPYLILRGLNRILLYQQERVSN